MRTCPSCAASDLPDPALVCGYCGTRLPTQQVEVASGPVTSTVRRAQLPPLPEPAVASEPGPRVDWVGIFGVLILASSAFMPWVQSPFATITPMSDIPMSLLWDRYAFDGPMLGLLILGLALLGLLELRQRNRGLVLVTALGVLAVAGVFASQVTGRSWRSTPFSYDVFEILDYGVYVALVAVLILGAAAYRLGRS